jgi:serine/threonine protein kinase
MSRGSLYDILHVRKEKLTYQLKLKIAIDTAKGMAYLSSQNIIHRDLKPHNILCDNSWNAKVADFGLARTKVATTMTRVGTPRWVAPEGLS